MFVKAKQQFLQLMHNIYELDSIFVSFSIFSVSFSSFGVNKKEVKSLTQSFYDSINIRRVFDEKRVSNGSLLIRYFCLLHDVFIWNSAETIAH